MRKDAFKNNGHIQFKTMEERDEWICLASIVLGANAMQIARCTGVSRSRVLVIIHEFYRKRVNRVRNQLEETLVKAYNISTADLWWEPGFRTVMHYHVGAYREERDEQD